MKRGDLIRRISVGTLQRDEQPMSQKLWKVLSKLASDDETKWSLFRLVTEKLAADDPPSAHLHFVPFI